MSTILNMSPHNAPSSLHREAKDGEDLQPKTYTKATANAFGATRQQDPLPSGGNGSSREMRTVSRNYNSNPSTAAEHHGEWTEVKPLSLREQLSAQKFSLPMSESPLMHNGSREGLIELARVVLQAPGDSAEFPITFEQNSLSTDKFSIAGKNLSISRDCFSGNVFSGERLKSGNYTLKVKIETAGIKKDIMLIKAHIKGQSQHGFVMSLRNKSNSDGTYHTLAEVSSGLQTAGDVYY